MLSFDFEATTALRQWHRALLIIKESQDTVEVDEFLLSVFMDFTLSSNVPLDMMIKFLEVSLCSSVDHHHHHHHDCLLLLLPKLQT